MSQRNRRPNIRAIVHQANASPTDVATGTQDGTPVSPPAGDRQTTKQLKSKRDRRSLYMDDTTLRKLNDAYKQLNHDVFPQEIKKVSFLAAIVSVALDHGDELRDSLLGPNDA